MREYPLQYASTDKNRKSHYSIVKQLLGENDITHLLYEEQVKNKWLVLKIIGVDPASPLRFKTIIV